jgi:class 3 adenylate cyclase
MDPAEFERVSSGLRFSLPQTEAAYRTWSEERSIPDIRAGTYAAVAAWIALLGLVLFLAPDQMGPLLWMLVVVLLTLVLSLATTTRETLRRWMIPTTTAANVAAGFLVGGMFHVWLGQPQLGSAALVFIVYFGFTVFQPRTVIAAMAALPYMLFNQVLLVPPLLADELDGTMFVAWSTGPWIAYGSGLMVCAARDRASREAYCQECVIEAQRRALVTERERADRLLYNMLPATIAERLKLAPQVIADRYEHVTVLFADIVGFTPLATNVEPERLVQILNDVFTRFDALAARRGVEKIKTIGDAYMAVAGVPESRSDHADAAADLALAMRAAVTECRDRLGHDIQLRVGLCTGTVVAGVLGTSKFAYDLWGDTVNTAARMESQGIAGEIQVTESTYLHLRDRYVLKERGEIDVKGKGLTRTWLLSGAAPGHRPES